MKILSQERLETLMDKMTDLVCEYPYASIIATLGVFIAEDESQNMEMRSFGKMLVYIADAVEENELEDWLEVKMKSQNQRPRT